MSEVYRVYPLRSVALYNGVTVLHFGLAAAGLVIAYDFVPALAWVLAGVYLAVALGQGGVGQGLYGDIIPSGTLEANQGRVFGGRQEMRA